VFDLSHVSDAAGLDTGNVVVIFGMLQSIHAAVLGDVVMGEFAETIALAMAQLRELQQIACETMFEIEAERAAAASNRRLRLVPDLRK